MVPAIPCRPVGEDLAIRLLAATMRAWIEWPHIDHPFDELFVIMPGRFTKNWVESDPQETVATN